MIDQLLESIRDQISELEKLAAEIDEQGMLSTETRSTYFEAFRNRLTVSRFTLDKHIRTIHVVLEFKIWQLQRDQDVRYRRRP